MPLTDIIVKNAKPKDKQYKLTDEKGLRLVIHPNGSKYWQMKYRHLNKEKTLSFGIYPEISLKDARNKREDARKQISNSLDPSEEKKLKKIRQHINADNSFENIALEWHERNFEKWKPRHANYILKRLKADIIPEIGFRPINQINAPELLATIQKNRKKRCF